MVMCVPSQEDVVFVNCSVERVLRVTQKLLSFVRALGCTDIIVMELSVR